MNTPNETDETLTDPSNGEDPTDDVPRMTVREWLAVPARVSRGWLLLSIGVGFVFLGCAIWAAIQTVKLDNQFTQEQVADSIVAQYTTCQLTNERRVAEATLAREVLAADQESLDRDEATLNNDHEIWDAIDELFPDGIPEPARTTIFNGLDRRHMQIDVQQDLLDLREDRIESAYASSDCELILQVTANRGVTPTTVKGTIP